MKTLFIISSDYGGLIFTISYTLALATGAAILILAGFRKKHNMGSVLLIILCCLVFFILGDKLLTVSPNHWYKILFAGIYTFPTGKNILGGIIGLLLGAFLSTRWLKFREPLLDNLAIAFPLAIAVQKVGCLLGGCCHGKPCDLPWAIEYGRNADAFHHQLHSGMINYEHTHALPVHPTQLYQIIGCLIVALLVYRFKDYWRAKGNLFLFTISMYGILRFITEFTKDPITNGPAGKLFMGLQIVQWGIMLALCIISVIMAIRERYLRGRIDSNIDNTVNWRHYTLYVLILLLISSQWGWFDSREKLMILVMTIPVLMLLLWRIYKRYTLPVIRWSLPLFILVGIIVMGQKIVTNDKANPPSYAEFSIGTGFGRFYNEVREYMGSVYSRTEQVFGLCGPYSYDVYVPVYEYHDRKHSFTTFALGGKYVFRFGQFKKLHLGASYFWSKEVEKDNESTFSADHLSKGISPMVRMDWHYFGFGLGGSLGSLRYARNHSATKGRFDHLICEYSWMPSVHLRLGPYNIFYAEFNYANSFPASSLAPILQGGLGTGLGRTDGTRILLGVSEMGFYAEANAVFRNKYVATLIFNGNFAPDTKNLLLVSAGFKYRILARR